MQRSSTLYGISFGKDDAAIEARGFLKKVFLKTSFYHRVKTGKKFLVTGRKGIGKSAICISLKTSLEEEHRSTLFVTSRLLSAPKMEQIKGTSINDQERSEASWRYVLLVKIAIELLNNVDSTDYKCLELAPSDKKQLREIRLFLSQNSEIDKTFRQNIIAFLSIFSKFSAKLPVGLEAQVETRQAGTIFDLSNTLDRFEESISTLLSRLQNFSLSILIDEVDDIWESTEESKLLIIGLLNTVRKLNSSFNSNVLILIFLRSDIWDSLSFSDKDKFRSEEERISWSEDDLKSLIATRGRISANLNISSDSVEQIWEIFFEPQVGEQDSFKYIVDRTLKRPREIIQFCNLALSIAQDKNNSIIMESDILAAESRYSLWKLDDIANEFKVQYPFLRSLLGIFQGFRVCFTKEQITLRYQTAKEKLIGNFPELHSLDLDSFLQLLFSMGFLGAKVNGKDIYIHDNPDLPTIVLANLTYLEAVVIHPAFHLALGTRDYVTQDMLSDVIVSGDIKVEDIRQVMRSDIIVSGDIKVEDIRQDIIVSGDIKVKDIKQES